MIPAGTSSARSTSAVLEEGQTDHPNFLSSSCGGARESVGGKEVGRSKRPGGGFQLCSDSLCQHSHSPTQPDTQPSAAAQTLWVGLSTFSPLGELLHILQGPIQTPSQPSHFVLPWHWYSLASMVITYVPFCPEEHGFPKGDLLSSEQRPGTKQRVLNLARIILFLASFCTLRGFPEGRHCV